MEMHVTRVEGAFTKRDKQENKKLSGAANITQLYTLQYSITSKHSYRIKSQFYYPESEM